MKNKNRGFTIIELIVVIAIIGVLAGIVTVFVITQGQKARDSRRVADLSQVQKALELYYAQYGCYPASTGTEGSRSTTDVPCRTPQIPAFNIADCTTVNAWWDISLKVLVDAKFLPSLPHDPTNSGSSGAVGCPWCGYLCYAYVGENTSSSMECGRTEIKEYDIKDYQYAIMFSTEKLTPSLPRWTYGGSQGTFKYCYVGKYIGP